MKQQTRILIGLIAIFLILIGLSTTIFITSRDVNCDSCVIEFKNTEVMGIKLEIPMILKVNATNLYGELINGTCLIRWSRTQGYIHGY